MTSRQKAFTLLELLMVMGIMTIMIALVAPSVTGMMRGYQLSAACETVYGTLSNARQLAVTKDHPIEVRLIDMVDPRSPSQTIQMRALQLIEIRPDGPHQIGKLQQLPVGVIVGAPPVMTSLSSLTKNQPKDSDPILPGVNKDYTYRSFQFLPDGSLNLPQIAELAGVTNFFLTIYEEKFAAVGNKPPPNFATIQLEPSTGEAILYRP